MTHLKLPEAWLDVISRVRSVLPSAFIAGGALRDLDNGRPVKDIDVFYTDDTYQGLGALDNALYGQYRYARQCPGEYLDGAAQEVSDTTTYESLQGLPELNLVQLAPSFNPASIVERVDFGICQVGYGLNGVVTTPAYEHDKANQRFTLTRAESVEGVVRSLKRYDRLKQKYQGWDLYWGAEFDALVNAAMAQKAMAEDSGGYTIAAPY